MFYCGNDPEAKAVAAKIIEQFGWEGADMGSAGPGPGAAVPALVHPGFRANHWTHAFRLLWS